MLRDHECGVKLQSILIAKNTASRSRASISSSFLPFTTETQTMTYPLPVSIAGWSGTPRRKPRECGNIHPESAAQTSKTEQHRKTSRILYMEAHMIIGIGAILARPITATISINRQIRFGREIAQ
jgi:hypothetical protein